MFSERFLLRELEVEDATFQYLSWLDDKKVNQFIAYAEEKRSLNDLKDYIEIKKNGTQVLFLGIFTKEDKVHIGNIKYEPIDTDKRVAVMGIIIGEPKWRGKGVATEVINRSAEWLYYNKNIKKIILGVDSSNKAAIRSYGKSGFVSQHINPIKTDVKSEFTMSLELNF